jgi:hypothetical protein
MIKKLAEVSEAPHFEKRSFRVHNRIFATLSPDETIACLKLSPVEQSVYCQVDPIAVYAVPNKWGQQGWTFVNVNDINLELLQEMILSAYNGVISTSRKKE